MDSSVPEIVYRRQLPGCSSVFCWGIHAGREWVVSGASHGRVLILCNGAAGSSNHCKSFSLWRIIDIRKIELAYDVHSSKDDHCMLRRRHDGVGRSSNVEATASSIFQSSAEEIDERKDGDNAEKCCSDELEVSSLAWCSPPSRVNGTRPLDPDAQYCASFAVGTTIGKIFIFYPSHEKEFEWTVVSVLEPEGDIKCLAWAPSGHHLVSGGSKIVLWTPEAPTNDPRSDTPTEFSSWSGEPQHPTKTAAKGRSTPVNQIPQVTDFLYFPPRKDRNQPGKRHDTSSEEKLSVVFDASWVLDHGNVNTIAADFSPDGRMFATLDENSVEVRVWYEGESLFGNLDYVSLLHPSNILSLEWRIRDSCSNLHAASCNSHSPQSLLTLCSDNVLRIWQESDPQIEEFKICVIISINVSSFDGGLINVGWLRFINYFEGLRSPFPEHTTYFCDGEDFVKGFNSYSSFFHASSHSALVWGQHQRKSAELRMGAIAQEFRSSLDWIVGVTLAGSVCMWSIEGLSDSPRREFHCLPWNYSVGAMFKQEKSFAIGASPYAYRREEDLNHSLRQFPHHLYNGGIEFANDGFMVSDHKGLISAERPTRTKKSMFSANGVSGKLVATCRVTQVFDPHMERDPWPSSCVYDIRPSNIEVVFKGPNGLVYSHEAAVVNESTTESPIGRQEHRDICVAAGHLVDIRAVICEKVIEADFSFAPIDSVCLLTTVDVDGVAIAWPTRSGNIDEEVDSDAISEGKSITLPQSGIVKEACCSRLSRDCLVAILITQDSNSAASAPYALEFWVTSEALSSGACATWRQYRFIDGVESAVSLFVMRKDYVVTVGLNHNDGDSLSLFRIEKKADICFQHLAHHKNLKIEQACGVSSGLFLEHNVVAIVATVDGRCLLVGDSDNQPIVSSFIIKETTYEEILHLSSSADGKIVSVHRSKSNDLISGQAFVKVWSPQVCCLRYELFGMVNPSSLVGDCDVICASTIFMGSVVDLIGIGIKRRKLSLTEGNTADKNACSEHILEVLIYASCSDASCVSKKFTCLGRTGYQLAGDEYLRGLVLTGPDLGLVAVTEKNLHLFQGWLRIDESPDSRKLVNSMVLKQIESLNSIGEQAFLGQSASCFYHPMQLLRMLKSGVIEPVKAILRALLVQLRERNILVQQMYGNDTPPANEMSISFRSLSLRDLLTKPDGPGSVKLGSRLSSANHESFAKSSSLLNLNGQSPSLSIPRDTYASEDRGRAADLFAEDPWEAILHGSNTAFDTSSSVQDVIEGVESSIDSSGLSELLTIYHIEGLDSRDQLFLSALAGVVDDIFGIDIDCHGIANGLDEAGARFIFFYHIFGISSCYLASFERTMAMSTSEIVWAFQSDCQDNLLEHCLPFGSTWKDACRIGSGLWIRSAERCIRLAEQLAKSQYSANSDPFSCALFYFALGRHKIVSQLFHLKKNTKYSQFLANDFSQDRWKSAAKKNAFSLLSKKRFEDAAALFLLGGWLSEAANVCVKNLHDYQLAIFLCKVVEGDWGPVQAKIWRGVVLPLAKMHGDRWLFSLCMSVLGNVGGEILSFLSQCDMEKLMEDKTSQVTGDLLRFKSMDCAMNPVSKVSENILASLRSESWPILTAGSNFLESIYLRHISSSTRVKQKLETAMNDSILQRILDVVSMRTVYCLDTSGAPLLAFFELREGNSENWCITCRKSLVANLAARLLYAIIISEPGHDMPLLESSNFEALSCDLQSIQENVISFSALKALNCLWQFARASNNLYVEILTLRLMSMRHTATEESNKYELILAVRIGHVLNSISSSLIGLGQDSILLEYNYRRRILPARRLAAYSLFLLKLSRSPKLVTMVDNERFMTQFRVLFSSFAFSALFSASYLLEDDAALGYLMERVKIDDHFDEYAKRIAVGRTDYEELLQRDAEKYLLHCVRDLNAAAKESHNSRDPDHQYSEWSSRYTAKLAKVLSFRRLLWSILEHCEKIYPMKNVDNGIGYSKPQSFPSNVFEDFQSLQAFLFQPGYGFCSFFSRSLVQACWPVNWTALSDLHIYRMPKSKSRNGSHAHALEAMKGSVSECESKDRIWRTLKGREHLRILDATSQWTARSLDQERTHEGGIPNPKVFCASNVKVIHTQPGILLSVDSIAGCKEPTVVVASEKGAEIIRFAFDTEEFDFEGGSEDEHTVSEHNNNSSMVSIVGSTGISLTSSKGDNSIERSASARDLLELSNEVTISNEIGESVKAEDKQKHHILPVPSQEDPEVKHHGPLSKLRRRSRRLATGVNSPRGIKFQRLSHAWSSSARILLLVSRDTEKIWWGDMVRMPLNGNLFADSFVHSVSFHERLARNLYASAFSNCTKKTRKEGKGKSALLGLFVSPDGANENVESKPEHFSDKLSNASTFSTAKDKTSNKSQKVSFSRKSLTGLGGKKNLNANSSVKESTSSRNNWESRLILHVESHPFLPYYASANWDGTCTLFDVETQFQIAHMNKPSSGWKSAQTTRVRFTENGMNLAGCDSAGQVMIWRLGDSLNGACEPFASLNCHTKRTLDLSFLNYSGSVFATVGQSEHSENLCLWDLSLPPRSNRIAKVHCCAHTAAYSVAHLQDEQVLLVGGGNGQLCVFDLRQRVMTMELEHVHQKAIRSLAVHPSKGNYFGTGSTDGTVKLWTYTRGKPTAHVHLTNMHPTHTFMNAISSDSLISQRGTTDLAFSRDFLITCGADGNVKMTPLSSLMV